MVRVFEGSDASGMHVIQTEIDVTNTAILETATKKGRSRENAAAAALAVLAKSQEEARAQSENNIETVGLGVRKMVSAGFLYMSVLGKDQFAQTPDSIYDLVCELLNISVNELYDPCPQNPTKDGLTTPWRKYNYVNPPFEDVASWLDKAVREAEVGNWTVVLLPARTHNVYFHNTVAKYAVDIVMLTTGVHFKPYKSPFPMPIALCVFGPDKKGRRISEIGHMKSVDAMSVRMSPRNSNAATLLKWLKSAKGAPRFAYVDPEVMDASSMEAKLSKSSNFIVIWEDTARCIDILQKHTKKYPKATTAVCVIARYQARWFREVLVPMIKQLVHIAPALRLAGALNGGVTGSVLAIIGKPLPALPTGPDIMQGYRITDESPLVVSVVKENRAWFADGNGKQFK
jgi:hypothetical protein